MTYQFVFYIHLQCYYRNEIISARLRRFVSLVFWIPFVIRPPSLPQGRGGGYVFRTRYVRAIVYVFASILWWQLLCRSSSVIYFLKTANDSPPIPAKYGTTHAISALFFSALLHCVICLTKRFHKIDFERLHFGFYEYS